MTNLKHFESMILSELSELGSKLYAAGELVAKLEKPAGYPPSKRYVDALEVYSELSGRNDALHDLLEKLGK